MGEPVITTARAAMRSRGSHGAVMALGCLLLMAPLVALPAPHAAAGIAMPHVRLWTRLLPGFLLVGVALRRRLAATAAR